MENTVTFDSPLKEHINFFKLLLEDNHKDVVENNSKFKKPVQKLYNEHWGFQIDEVENLIQNINNDQSSKNFLMYNPTVLQYFKKNLNQHANLLSQLINESNSVDDFLIIIKYNNAFPKSLLEHPDFSETFINTLLKPIISLSARVDNEQIIEQTSKLIYKCIFQNNVKVFQNYLNKIFTGEKSTEVALPKLFIKFLQSIYSESDSTGFKIMFSAISNFIDFEILFKFFVIFLEIIGFEMKEEFNLHKTTKLHIDITPDKSLKFLSEVMKVFTGIKIDIDCVINFVTFMDLIQNLLKSVMSFEKPNHYTYAILTTSIKIHPLIIEPISDEIIIYSMLNNNENLMQDYEILLTAILETFSKLRRFQNFVSKMIPVLKLALEFPPKIENIYKFRGIEIGNKLPSDLSFDVNLMFPKKSLFYFTDCVTDLPSWQVINMFKTFIFHLDQAVKELQATEDPKKSFYVSLLSYLTSWFLCSVKLSSIVVEKFVACLDELKAVLKQFGVALLHRKHDHLLMEGFLNTCYNWAEVYLVLTYYSINNEIEMEKNLSNDISASNIHYLHSYLSTKRWGLISQRITNFGEKPSQNLMHKLIIQKLRAMKIFEKKISEDHFNSVTNLFISDFREVSMEIISEGFFMNNIFPKLTSEQWLNFAERILEDDLKLLDNPQVFENQIVTNALITIILKQLNKSLRQKRKHDDVSVRKAFFLKLYATLPENLLLTTEVDNFLPTIKEAFKNDVFTTENKIDLAIKQEKLIKIFENLKKLAIFSCPEEVQKVILLLLFSLHQDILRSNCDVEIKTICEDIILGVVQSTKFPLSNIIDVKILIDIIVEDFANFEELFTLTLYSIAKHESGVADFFQSFATKDLNDVKYLKCAVIVVNFLNKVKKSKMSSENKNLCLDLKPVIFENITKLTVTENVKDYLVEPFALSLKHYQTSKEENLEKLKSILNNYLDFAFNNPNVCVRGSLLLFITILREKLGNDNLTLQIWNCCKAIEVNEEDFEEFSQLVMLIIGLIPNQEFSKITDDLLEFIQKSISEKNIEQLCKNLRFWSSIISCNVNPFKTKLIQQALESLLHQLVLAIKTNDFNEFIPKITQFSSTIIQTNLLPLTPIIIDIFLLLPTLLLGNFHIDFFMIYKIAMNLLNSLLKYRKAFILDRLPVFLQNYKFFLKELCKRSNSDLKLDDFEVQKYADCGHQMEKLTKNLVACSRDMARLAPYLIADILMEYELFTLYPNVKFHLNNCIYSLISLCDQHAISLLMRVLTNASTEIFKIMYENYKKYYRFTGKI